jgi:hypothetical protein
MKKILSLFVLIFIILLTGCSREHYDVCTIYLDDGDTQVVENVTIVDKGDEIVWKMNNEQTGYEDYEEVLTKDEITYECE